MENPILCNARGPSKMGLIRALFRSFIETTTRFIYPSNVSNISKNESWFFSSLARIMKLETAEIHPIAKQAFGMTAYTHVGHLIHVNLKEDLLPQKHQIGQAFLDKSKRCLAVVNKVNSIDNEYRNFELEIIAKRPDCQLSDEELMIVETRENKCRFQMDFSKVYWNSRLSTEHERMINKFHPDEDIIFDLFAGVGPFSVPAGKIRCRVYANDLNPEAVHWLKRNMTRNKVETQLYEIHNMDAKDFIKNCLKDRLIDVYKIALTDTPSEKPKIHILMNLPALAPQFLPHFTSLLKEDADKKVCGDLTLRELFQKVSLDHKVYCYCFLKGVYDDPKDEVRKLIEENFQRQLEDHQLIEIFKVRNVAPYKFMYRVEMRLDESILFGDESILTNHALKGILTNSGDRLSMTNGHSSTKKVTIKESERESKKRKRDEEEDDDDEVTEIESDPSLKRSKFIDYCSIT